MAFVRSGTTLLLMLLTAALVGCADGDKADPFALYRNSPLDYSMRIHWATFDAEDKGSYNMNNCLMAARLLNANVTASAKAEGNERDTKAGFWCEAGPYKERGLVPTNFPEAFPTDV
jgi:hypothetical protein